MTSHEMTVQTAGEGLTDELPSGLPDHVERAMFDEAGGKELIGPMLERLAIRYATQGEYEKGLHPVVIAKDFDARKNYYIDEGVKRYMADEKSFLNELVARYNEMKAGEDSFEQVMNEPLFPNFNPDFAPTHLTHQSAETKVDNSNPETLGPQDTESFQGGSGK